MTPIWKTKTFWVMTGAIVVMVGKCVTGEAEWLGMLDNIFLAIGGITIRDKMVKQGTGL